MRINGNAEVRPSKVMQVIRYDGGAKNPPPFLKQEIY